MSVSWYSHGLITVWWRFWQNTVGPTWFTVGVLAQNAAITAFSLILLSQIWVKTYRLAKLSFNIWDHPRKDVPTYVIVERCDRITAASVTFTGPEGWKQNCSLLSNKYAAGTLVKKKKNLDIDLREMRWRGYTVIYDMFTVHQQTAFLPLNLQPGSQLSQEICWKDMFF